MGLLEVEQQQAGSRSYNQYPDVNTDRIEVIKMGKVMGFTLKEIAVHMDAYFSGQLTVKEQIEIFEDRLSAVSVKIKELEDSKSYIKDKIAMLRSDKQSAC